MITKAEFYDTCHKYLRIRNDRDVNERIKAYLLAIGADSGSKWHWLWEDLEDSGVNVTVSTWCGEWDRTSCVVPFWAFDDDWKERLHEQQESAKKAENARKIREAAAAHKAIENEEKGLLAKLRAKYPDAL